jgi:hypothetical protein
MVILGMEYEMNERIKELAKEAGAHISTRNLMSNPPQHVETVELWDDKIEKFAEMIVKECIYTLQLKIVRNGNTPENLRSREHIRDLGEKFGIEFPMDYYPDRNKHFGVES